MTYDQADDKAVELVNSGKYRIVFVAMDTTRASSYIATPFADALALPLKRYMRDSRGYVSVVAVTNWRRN